MLTRWLLALIFVLSAAPAGATVYCVDKSADGILGPTTTGLLNALQIAKAAPEGTRHEIRLQAGTFPLSNADVLFEPDDAHDDKELLLLGGFEPGCQLAERKPLPVRTAIVGPGSLTLGGGLHVGVVGWKSLRVEAIAFEDLDSVAFTGDTCDWYCQGGEVRIAHNEFRSTDVLVFFSILDGPRFLNNLLVQSPLDVLYTGDHAPPQVAFNTIADGKCGSTRNAAVLLDSFVSGAKFHHNIVQSDDCDAEIEVGGNGSDPWVFRNNMFESELAGGGTYVLPFGMPAHGNIQGAAAADPVFEDGGDYRPAAASPAVDAGLTIGEIVAAVGGDANSSIGDLNGFPRLTGPRYDIGAYEFGGVAEPLVVTRSTDDGEQGSLRWAIGEANAGVGPQRIHFAIPGAGCPKILLLNSDLPPITQGVSIDSYTQPGSLPNADPVRFDAKLCVVLSGNVSSSVFHGLQVPSSASLDTSLTVRGLAFTGFVARQAAVRLAGGEGHVIAGNSFEGTTFGADSLDAIRIVQAGSVQVGGPDNEDRNLFSGVVRDAVRVDVDAAPVVIDNNIIGLAGDGKTVKPVGNGIHVSSGSKVTIRNNVIAAAQAGIWLTGSKAEGVRIHGNLLGVNAFGIAEYAAANGIGILIEDGSGGHLIGTSGTANVIANSKGPGVFLPDGENEAGMGSKITGNSIFHNGHTDGGLGIDLGSPGQSPNDLGDLDAGPNGRQNWPLMLGSVPLQNGKRRLSGSLGGAAGVSHRIHIYRSPTCPAGMQGSDAKELVAIVYPVVPVLGFGFAASAKFSVDVAAPVTPGYLTATATSAEGTSEIGTCFKE